MKPKYRVEAFIIPKCVTIEEEVSRNNEIDDVKVANKLIKIAESTTETDFICEDDIEDKLEDNEVIEPIYDVPYSCKIRENHKFEVFPPKISARASSLVSIDERGETDGIMEEFCFHGYTTETQPPEEVSEKIFRENWLKRLESLREREAVLKDKENILQERERLLFKKERELRILERLVKDKLKEADLYLKRCKSSQSIESMDNFDAKTKSSEGSRDSRSSRNICLLNNQPFVDPLSHNREETKTLATKSHELKQSMLSLGEEKTMKNPPNSRSSLITTTSINLKADEIVKSREPSTFPTRRYLAGSSAYYSSLRCKPRPKMSYDDLDSTLSADIGDSSYIVTSGKFDPHVFKKPYAFMRSTSERRARVEQEKKEEIRGFTAEDKVLKRLSENIQTSQDKSTKYLDYGIIDRGVNLEDVDKRRNSYFDAERGTQSTAGSISRRSKERPVSWNEETNEWLQKKRQAFNLANKRIPNECFDNKENFDSDSARREKCEKMSKKKESKTKKFGIFR